MYRHRHFNLYLHHDEELSSLVRANIVERVTLHEWPLSCVQRLSASDGRQIIYKAQFGPTVESEFYANASSKLLVSAETVYRSNGYACLLIEFIAGPLARELDWSEDETVRTGRAVLAQIAKIAGHLPYVVDVSNKKKWQELINATLKELGKLVGQTKLSLVNRETISRLKKWSYSRPVLAAIGENPGYVHADLAGDNVFVLPDGYRVIDWQRPILGPTDLDLASWLESMNIDPFRYVEKEIVWILRLLRIHWFTQCGGRWFPPGIKTYDKSIARLASLVGESS